MNATLYWSVAVGSGIAAGFTGGYFYAKKRLSKLIWDEALEAVNEEHEALRKRKETDEDFREAVDEKISSHMKTTISDLGYIEFTDEEDTEEVGVEASYSDSETDAVEYLEEVELEGDDAEAEEIANAFLDGLQQNLDLPLDVLEQRLSPGPYIITEEEYMNDEEDYSKSVVTYYKGDNTFADDMGTPISNPDEIFLHGIEDMFGTGASDDYTVYVRNDERLADYEIQFEEVGWATSLIEAQNDKVANGAKKNGKNAKGS